jgi:hypothetical protein
LSAVPDTNATLAILPPNRRQASKSHFENG